jgi:hypothetical protein
MGFRLGKTWSTFNKENTATDCCAGPPVHTATTDTHRHDADTSRQLGILSKFVGCRWMWTGPFKVTVTVFSCRVVVGTFQVWISLMIAGVAQSVYWLQTGRPGDRGSIAGRGKEFFLYPLCPDRLLGPPSLLSERYRGFFPGGKALPGRDADHSPVSRAEFKNE